MSLETCPTCGKFMSKKEIDYSLSHFGNKSCKACDKKKYTVSSTGPQNKRVHSTTVEVTDDHSYESKLDLDKGGNKPLTFGNPVLTPVSPFLNQDFNSSETNDNSSNTNTRIRSQDLAEEKLQKLESQINGFPTENIGLLIGAFFAFLIPVIGPIIAIVLVVIWNSKRKKKSPQS